MTMYGAILADPPWRFVTYSERGTRRGAASHYNVMPFDALAAIPVGDWAARDCILFLWVPKPNLLHGLQLIAAWGFVYKTIAFTWVKPCLHEPGYRMTMGYWTRSNPEICLMATRGQPTRLAADVRELIEEPLRQHSQKPDRVRDDIERLVAGPYLEMFARVTAPGWDAYGDQVGLFDAGPVRTRRQPSSKRPRLRRPKLRQPRP